jgi:hypothetical protein
MVICGSYMFDCNVSKYMKKNNLKNKTLIPNKRSTSNKVGHIHKITTPVESILYKEVVVAKVVAHLCQTLIVKELKISVQHDRLVITINIIKH